MAYWSNRLTDAYGNEKQMRTGTIIETPDGDWKIISNRDWEKTFNAVPAADYKPGDQWFHFYYNQRTFSYQEIISGRFKFRGKGKLGEQPAVKQISKEIWAF